MNPRQPVQRQYSSAEEIMASINKLQDNYKMIANTTTIAYQNMSPREVYKAAVNDLAALKQFVAERLGVPPEFRG